MITRADNYYALKESLCSLLTIGAILTMVGLFTFFFTKVFQCSGVGKCMAFEGIHTPRMVQQRTLPIPLPTVSILTCSHFKAAGSEWYEVISFGVIFPG
jgi:hypothetical protein